MKYNTFLNNPRLKKKSIKNLKVFFLTENENMTFETVKHISKVVPRKKFILLNRLFIKQDFNQ